MVQGEPNESVLYKETWRMNIVQTKKKDKV